MQFDKSYLSYSMERLPIYNCLIEERDETTGIYAISFVDEPANEVDFVALSKANKEPVFLNRDNQKQILTGVVLKPEQLIYRFSPELGGYYIKFSASEIEKISHRMMKTGIALRNTTHQHEKQLSGNYLIELWIVENPDIDKSRALGFKDLPKGTLMCSYKIEDTNYWKNEVITGNVKGFSLEGFFNQIPTQNNLQMKKPKLNLSSLQKRILKATLSKGQLSAIDEIEKEDSTDSGETVREFVLQGGEIVIVDEDGLATLNDEPMQAGDHALADGNILVIDESGKFVETKEPSAKTDDSGEATAKEALAKVSKELSKTKRKLQKLEEETVEDKDSVIATLKQMVADQQAIIDELKSQLETSVEKVEEAQGVVEEQKAEIAELKKITPSTPPARQKKEELSKPETLSEIASRVALSIKNKK